MIDKEQTKLNISKPPSMLDAFIPVITLISLLTLAVSYFGDNSSYGPNQIALLIAMGVAIIIGFKNGANKSDKKYKDIAAIVIKKYCGFKKVFLPLLVVSI